MAREGVPGADPAGAAGKIQAVALGLRAEIEGNFEALEADFQWRYQLDLRRACWGPEAVSVRRLLALIRALPDDSAYVRAHDPNEGWHARDYMLAALVDEVRYLHTHFIQAHTPKGKGPRGMPDPLPRPGQSAPQALPSGEATPRGGDGAALPTVSPDEFFAGRTRIVEPKPKPED